MKTKYHHLEVHAIDQKATIRAVKRELKFLSEHIWMLQGEDEVIVEDSLDLIDFLPYTRSVINLTSSSTNEPYESAIIKAMEKRERVRQRQKEVHNRRMEKLELLIWAISCLPRHEKLCITMKYIHHTPIQTISAHMRHSASTTHRLLDRSYLHLAELLELEIPVKQPVKADQI